MGTCRFDRAPHWRMVLAPSVEQTPHHALNSCTSCTIMDLSQVNPAVHDDR